MDGHAGRLGRQVGPRRIDGQSAARRSAGSRGRSGTSRGQKRGGFPSKIRRMSASGTFSKSRKVRRVRRG
eukprot:scaffold2808_cov255-Pinguiococcus_pyrenoidosus.AAC.38